MSPDFWEQTWQFQSSKVWMLTAKSNMASMTQSTLLSKNVSSATETSFWTDQMLLQFALATRWQVERRQTSWLLLFAWKKNGQNKNLPLCNLTQGNWRTCDWCKRTNAYPTSRLLGYRGDNGRGRGCDLMPYSYHAQDTYRSVHVCCFQLLDRSMHFICSTPIQRRHAVNCCTISLFD